MIKEKQKKTKYSYNKSKQQVLIDYLKTITCSLLIALLITTGLSIHARNEMIKDLLSTEQEQNLLDRKLALEIIYQTDLTRDLKNKTYSVCINAGEIYQAAEDYVGAQRAYELAIEKNKTKTYKPYYKLISVLVAQEKFDDAQAVLDNINDISNKELIRFKTKSYLNIGDKYYSLGKFLSAAKTYEKAKFYYDKFSKKDQVINNSINNRIVNAYIQVADIMVKTGLNSDAVRFLKKAEEYSPKDFNIRYKLAIVLADLDPETSVKYFETLLQEKPQEIDCGVYNTALMKAANIADLDNRPTQAKYYRYMIRSTDLFLNRKVVYKNDIEVEFKPVPIKKVFFHYPLKSIYAISNNSIDDITDLKCDFVLYADKKPIETHSKQIANKNSPLLSNTYISKEITVNFKKKLYTKKDLNNYIIKVYAYKDEKYKTYIGETSFIKK